MSWLPRSARCITLALAAFFGTVPSLRRLHAQLPSTEPILQSAPVEPTAVNRGASTSPSVGGFRLGPGSDAATGLGGQAGAGQPPPYDLLRYDEDYRYLKDPALRTDLWDPLKYIPLAEEDDWYASFGAQIRPRLDYFNNFNF